MRHLCALAALCLALGALAGPARACSKRHQSVFELFDRAADVAVVKVTNAPPPRGAGGVGLRVKQQLKGRKRAAIAAIETNTSCRVGFRVGRTALVFISADRWPEGAYEGYRERPSAALVAAMVAWAKASTPAERAAVLVDTIAGGDRELVLDAAFYLADQPAAISALTQAQLATVVAARGDPRTDEALLWVIARNHGQPWLDAIVAGLPPRSPALAALAAHDYESITDAGALADLIAQTPGEESPVRIAAFERCERVHGAPLDNFTSYGFGRSVARWKQLAEACRTGTPPP